MNKKVEFLVKTAGILLMCVAMMCACKCKVCEDGEDGVQGAPGAQGIPGNAEVKMYTYGSKTSIYDRPNNTLTYAIPLTAAALEKSHVYAYYKMVDSNDWFPVVSNAIFNLLTHISGTNYIVSFYNADGGALPDPVTFSAFKIIVVPIPDENITEVKSAVSIDFGNYSEVAAYYGLSE